MFGLTILGNNSALPAYGRHPTAQVLQWADQSFLIDCGEGTQLQMSQYQVRRGRITHIFISHLHGDHYFGLAGLITSMALTGREQPLYLHGPAALEPILALQLEAGGNKLPFPLIFKPNTGDGLIAEGEKFAVCCFAVKHRIECWGYLFKEKKPPRRLVPEAAIAAGIPQHYFSRLKWGADYTHPGGGVVPNAQVTVPAAPPLSYAYCADTLYDPSLAKKVKGVTLLYHEATFLHELAQRAAERYHSTARQAALIALEAGVQRLIIGHFSSKYPCLEPLLQEAQQVFAATELALEGATYRLWHQRSIALNHQLIN